MNVLAQKIPGLTRHQVKKPKLNARMREAVCRLNERVTRDFPCTLDAATFDWGRQNVPELISEIGEAENQANFLVLEANDKKIPEEKAWAAIERWRDLTIELFRRRDAAMRQEQC
jgi:hypothetical protein